MIEGEFTGTKLDRHNLVALRKAKLAAARIGEVWGNDDWYAMVGPILDYTNQTCYALDFFEKKTDKHLAATFIMNDCL
jgi:hypothetical protein